MQGKTRFGLLLLGASLSCSVFGTAHADAPPPKVTFETAVPMQCGAERAAMGSRSVKLTNNTGADIPKGKTLRWTTSDGETGKVKLEELLAKGASVSAAAGNGRAAYRCNASFSSLPDLVPLIGKWESPGKVLVNVRNADPWVDAGLSVVTVEQVSCASHAVLDKVSTQPFALGAKTAVGIAVAMTPVPKTYLRVRADANGQVTEKDETNNVWEDMDPCLK